MQSYNFLSTKLVPAQRTGTNLIKAYFASCYTPEDTRPLISTPTYSIPSPVTSSSALVVQLFS